MSENQRERRGRGRNFDDETVGWSIGRDDLGNAVLNWAGRESDRAEYMADNLLKRLECPELSIVEDEADPDVDDPYNREVVQARRFLGRR